MTTRQRAESLHRLAEELRDEKARIFAAGVHAGYTYAVQTGQHPEAAPAVPTNPYTDKPVEGIP